MLGSTSEVIGVAPEALASLASRAHLSVYTPLQQVPHMSSLKDYWCVALHSFQLLWSPLSCIMHHSFLCVSLNNSWPPFQRLFFPFPSQDANPSSIAVFDLFGGKLWWKHLHALERGPAPCGQVFTPWVVSQRPDTEPRGTKCSFE